jgi:hypothetical protein
MIAIFGVLIIIDFLFLDDAAFVFEPDVKVRRRRQQRKATYGDRWTRVWPDVFSHQAEGFRLRAAHTP